MKSIRSAKVAGWFLVIGPLVDVLVSVGRPGTFPGESPDGVQAAMQAGVHAAASNPTLYQLMVDFGFIASFGLLIGFWGIKQVMADTDGRGHLRRLGMVILTIALGVRSAAFAMGFLFATTLSFTPLEALDSGPALDTAVMFLVMEGSLGVFATMLTLAGVAFFAVSMMNAGLFGPDRLVNSLMGVVPAVVTSLLLLGAPFFSDGIFTSYVIGNVVALVQVAWIIVLGAVLVRKGDSLTAA